MEEEYSYWEVNFISCEGNERWCIYRAPEDFDDLDMENHIETGGCGDDIAEITSIIETYPDDPDDVSNYIWEREY
jgi:hypothetical protein